MTSKLATLYSFYCRGGPVEITGGGGVTIPKIYSCKGNLSEKKSCKQWHQLKIIPADNVKLKKLCGPKNVHPPPPPLVISNGPPVTTFLLVQIITNK